MPAGAGRWLTGGDGGVPLRVALAALAPAGVEPVPAARVRGPLRRTLPCARAWAHDEQRWHRVRIRRSHGRRLESSYPARECLTGDRTRSDRGCELHDLCTPVSPTVHTWMVESGDRLDMHRRTPRSTRATESALQRRALMQHRPAAAPHQVCYCPDHCGVCVRHRRTRAPWPRCDARPSLASAACAIRLGSGAWRRGRRRAGPSRRHRS